MATVVASLSTVCYFLFAFIAVVRSLKMRMSMEYCSLGTSDLKVSKVILGSMTWGQQNTLEEALDQLDVAFNQYGINCIDTAEMYPVPTKEETQGFTDLMISKWLKTIDRSKVVIATKVAGRSDRLNYLPGRNRQPARVSRSDIFASVEASLERLGTDYIDLLQIHWPDRYVPLFGAGPYDMGLERTDDVSFEEQLRALEELISSGKVRHIGVSNETPYGLMSFIHTASQFGLSKMVSIQNAYNLLTRSDYETGLIEVSSPKNCNVGLLAYSPLAGGILTGKYAKEDCPKTARLNLFDNYMARYKQSLAQEAVKLYSDVALKYGMTLTELSLGWCYTRPHVAATIIGATSVDQLKENMIAYEKRLSITSDVIADIEDVYKRYRDPAKI